MSHYEKYKSMLTEIGGWDNSLVNVNAGAVKAIIKEVGNLEAKVKEQADRIEKLRNSLTTIYKEMDWLPEDAWLYSFIDKVLKDKQDAY